MTQDEFRMTREQFRHALTVAFVNYDWLLENRPDDAGFLADCKTLVYGDGGVDVEVLTEEGFAPATTGDWLQPPAARADWEGSSDSR